MRCPQAGWNSVAGILAVALALSPAGAGAAQRRQIDVERSTITIRVFKSGLFRAFGDNHVVVAPIAQGALDDSAIPSVDLVIESRALRVLDPDASPKDRNDVQARMLGPEVLDAGRFPEIRFHSTAVQSLGRDRWLVRGDLDLHGLTRQVAVDVTRENGRYVGRTALRQTDFGITPVSVAAGTVKVKDELSVEFAVIAR